MQRNDVTAAFYPNKLGGARARALLPLQLLSSLRGTRTPAAGASSWVRTLARTPTPRAVPFRGPARAAQLAAATACSPSTLTQLRSAKHWPSRSTVEVSAERIGSRGS